MFDIGAKHSEVYKNILSLIQLFSATKKKDLHFVSVQQLILGEILGESITNKIPVCTF